MLSLYNESEAIFKHVSLRLNNLKALKFTKEQSIKKAPKGNLRVTTSDHGCTRVFLVNKKHPKGKYISKEKWTNISAIAQRDYDKNLICAIDSESKLLEKFLAKYNADNLASVWNNLSKGRKQLVKPVCIGSNQFVEQWLAEPYKRKPVDEENSIETSNGLRVRSKSEVIIAETLSRLGVPFRYEYPLNVRGHGVFHPDFYCLNERTRKEFIWEHFGLMDDAEYTHNAVEKINLYANEGFVLGDNLIATFETMQTPLNAKVVKEIVDRLLK